MLTAPSILAAASDYASAYDLRTRILFRSRMSAQALQRDRVLVDVQNDCARASGPKVRSALVLHRRS